SSCNENDGSSAASPRIRRNVALERPALALPRGGQSRWIQETVATDVQEIEIARGSRDAVDEGWHELRFLDRAHRGSQRRFRREVVALHAAVACITVLIDGHRDRKGNALCAVGEIRGGTKCALSCAGRRPSRAR